MDIKSEQNLEIAILNTAEKLFLEKGFNGTSTVQIAKEVGCNQALVHYYYRTKENLFNQIFETKFRSFFQSVFDSTNLENLSFIDKIKYISETHFDLLFQNQRIPMLIINDLSGQPEQMKKLRENLHLIPEQLISLMNKDLQQEINAGRIRNVSFMDIVITIVSLNVALFTMLPVASRILELEEEKTKEILLHRKEENVKIILSYLRP